MNVASLYGKLNISHKIVVSEMNMKKLKLIALVAMLVITVTACGAALAACNDTPSGGTGTVDDGTVGVGSMGVDKFPDTFTNDLDVTDAENLALSATATASSAEGLASNVLDGNTQTAWTAEETTGQYLEITLSSPSSFNTIVLRENGNYISGFSFVLPDEKGEYPTDGYGYYQNAFYRQQDRIERYRYCTFDAVHDVTSFRIYFGYTDAGKKLSVAEVEIYDVEAKEYAQDFRVFNYYTPQDLQYMDQADLLEDFESDTITDVILISLAFWMEDGSIVYAEDPQNYDTSAQDYDPERDQFRFVGEHEDPDGYYNAAVQKVHDAIAAHVARGGRNINICIDFYPKIVEQNGLPGNTDALVQSIHKLIVEDDRVDGIDIDWEYPTGVSEWKAYGDMLVAVDEDFDASGKNKYISLALSADNVRLTQEQIDAVDFVQMMAYDRFDITDGNHSSFRSGAYSSMRYFVNMGFDPSQLVLGIPLYGRPVSWDTVWTNYGYGDEVYATQDKTPYTYWDNTQWLYFGGTNLDGVPYDDSVLTQVWVNGPALVADKTAYVIEQGFAGMMLWRESTDCGWEDTDINGMPMNLLRAIHDTASERILGYGN